MLDRALEPLLTPLLRCWTSPWRMPRGRRSTAPSAGSAPSTRSSSCSSGRARSSRSSCVFEDLHWIDSETQAVLDGLIESLPTARILLLVNYRPEYEHAWGRKTYYLQLRIDPLPPESAEALLDALLGEDRTLSRSSSVLIERTEGNPFFLEESVRTLVETRVLVGERGAYRLAKAPDDVADPGDGAGDPGRAHRPAPPEDKRLLQAASVIGKDVPFALLHAIADLPEDGLRRGLSHLQAAEFLYETSLFPDLEYTFKHALTHEVAYGEPAPGPPARAPRPDRRGHRGALRRAPDRARRAAGPPRRSAASCGTRRVAYLRQAGAKAFGRSANREAVGAYEQALAALAHLPETRETMEQASTFASRSGTRSGPLGRFEPGFGASPGRRAPGRRRSDDQRRLGWIAAYLSEHTRQTGHAADAPRIRRARPGDRRGARRSAARRRRELLPRLGLFRRAATTGGSTSLLPDPRRCSRAIDSASAVASRASRSRWLASSGVGPRRARRVRRGRCRGRRAVRLAEIARSPLHSDHRVAGPQPSSTARGATSIARSSRPSEASRCPASWHLLSCRRTLSDQLGYAYACPAALPRAWRCSRKPWRPWRPWG